MLYSDGWVAPMSMAALSIITSHSKSKPNKIVAKMCLDSWRPWALFFGVYYAST